MSTNHTQHYGLCQWQATDKVLRTDFNEDNAKLDAALADLAKQVRHVVGTYVGDGTKGRRVERFALSAVFLVQNGSQFEYGRSDDEGYPLAALILDGHDVVHPVSGLVARIVDNGFEVNEWGSFSTNSVERTYFYIAWG